MKFTGVILNMDGVADSLGDAIKEDAFIKLPAQAPVYFEFDCRQQVAVAKLKRDGNVVKYELEIPESQQEILKHFIPCIGGEIKERSGDCITKVEITSIGLSRFNVDRRIKPLKDQT